MLKLTNPRLRRFDVVVNSFDSCISDTPKEFSRTPEMPMPEMVSKPRMFFEKAESRIALKKLKSLANAHGWRKLNKQVDMINSDVEFINFTLPSISNLSNKELTIHPQAIELEGIPCVFNFPHEVESILSKAMFSGFQIHFSSPEHSSNYVQFNSRGLGSNPNLSNHLGILNFEDGDSSPSLKTWVSSPWM